MGVRGGLKREKHKDKGIIVYSKKHEDAENQNGFIMMKQIILPSQNMVQDMYWTLE